MFRSKLKYKSVEIREKQFNLVYNILQFSDKPILIRIKTKQIIQSSDIAELIKISKLHEEKFDKKVILKGISDLQKRVFKMLKVDNLFDYYEGEKT